MLLIFNFNMIVLDTITSVASKPKRRPYLLKRKALTTSIFDGNRKENEKGSKD